MGQQLLTASENFCPEEMHILGDAAYKLHPFLMVLFKDNVHLTPSQVRFKRVLSKTRMPVERGFGLLKCRFRRLFYLSLQKVAYGLLIIVACCVLHNICLDRSIYSSTKSLSSRFRRCKNEMMSAFKLIK